MKISDIPKLTSVGNYSVTVSLAYIQKTINDYIAESKLQMNPDFQRGHIWNETQQIKYIEFLLAGGHTNNEFLFNQAGWMGDWKGEMTLVDGLQRLTAILKFVNNKLPVFNGTFLNDFDDPRLLLKQINVRINVNNLKTRQEVLKWYLELNSNGTPHTEEEIQKVQKMLEESK